MDTLHIDAEARTTGTEQVSNGENIMNDKMKEKADTKIEAEELKDEALGDEELENVDGGPHFRNFHDVGTYSYSTSTDSASDHDGWIDVLSIDWGSHKPGG